MSNRTVLISGAGIAGPTLAYWLARHGFQPTVVERTGSMRSSGSPIDVQGQAVDVGEKMGIMSRLYEVGTDVTEMSFIDAKGRRVGRINMGGRPQGAGSHEVEVPRGDLASVIQEASRDSAEFIFDDSITALSQDADGVDVTFDRTAPRRFDLVIGADGLHSVVRRLTFGPESDFVEHMDMYIATTQLDSPADNAWEIVMYNTPGRAVTIHPGRGQALAAFMFRGPLVPDFDYRDTDQHKRLLTEAFEGLGWRVPELIAHVQTAEDLYFDSVSRVNLPTWSQGRITLLGDAASCVSLLGGGSSLAMIGAYTLAGELAASPDDHEAAFRRYEATHRKLVDPRLRNIKAGVSWLVPTNMPVIMTRNLITRVWWSVETVAGWLRFTSPRVRD